VTKSSPGAPVPKFPPTTKFTLGALPIPISFLAKIASCTSLNLEAWFRWMGWRTMCVLAKTLISARKEVLLFQEETLQQVRANHEFAIYFHYILILHNLFDYFGLFSTSCYIKCILNFIQLAI
jgi:hypothetical protein